MSSMQKPQTSWQPDDSISAEDLKVMRAEVEERIVVVRIGLLLQHPFFGNLATRLKVVCADDWCSTAATDGRHLYFNTQFFNAMTNGQIKFVIAHEILHCVLDHLHRREDRIPWIHNIATDYCANNILVRDRIGEVPSFINIFQDFKYLEWSSEDVYDDLIDQAEDTLQSLGSLLDDHIDWVGDGDDEGEGNGDKKSNGQPKYSKEEFENIRNEIKESVIQAAQNSSGAGDIPKEIQRLVSDLTQSKVSWREVLPQEIQSIVRNDFTFTRPNRKSMHSGAILPGMSQDPSIDIAVAIDTSGSISNEQVTDFLSEVKGIMDQYTSFNVKVWCFDTDVHNFYEFDISNGDDIYEYQPAGGGGTKFEVNWEFMEENDILPKKLIMFTDGYPWGSWGDESYCDTIFVIHGDDSITAPFGMTIHYD